MELANVEAKHMGIEEIREAALGFMENAQAANTTKAYRSDWNAFVAWCESHSLVSLPAAPETVAAYITAEAQSGRKTSTIQRRLSSISQAHQSAGFDSPTQSLLVRKVWAGIRKTVGVAQKEKAPALVDDVRAMVETLNLDSNKGLRDRALILVGFAGAFRRSELVAIDFDDLTFTGDGVTINVRRSKTDQEGEGRLVGIPYGANPATCPVRALEYWIEVTEIESGAIFRSVNKGDNVQEKRLSDKDVARAVKRLAEAAGLNAENYAGHSLRAGFATAAAQAGKSERAIMKQTGHASERMVRKYIRNASVFIDNAASGIGL